MTLTSTTVKLTYNGDGVQESFPVTFNFWDLDDLKVILRDENVTPATETTMTRGATYNVTGGNGSTGTVDIITPPSSNIPVSGEKLIIKSNVPSTQTTSLPLGGAIPSASLEQRLDKNVRLIQQREEELDRSIKLSETSSASEVILTDPATGEFLRWKADGSLESAPLSASGTATGVDETDTDTTKDKLVSNLLMKNATDTAQAVKGVQVASAVNQLQVTNSATGNPVLIAPTGTDANPDVDFSNKGTGAISFDNVRILGNTISSKNTNGALNLTPNGTGDLVLDGQKWPQADGSARQTLRTDGAGQTSWGENITLGTEQATTSGTAIDFTGIPAGVKRITVMFNGVSLSGTDSFLVQLGDSGGIETTGYVSTSSITTGISTDTTGFIIRGATASRTLSVHMVLTRVNSSHLWVQSHIGKVDSAVASVQGGGDKTLSGELTQVRVTRDGSNTFDAGSVNIMYEV